MIRREQLSGFGDEAGSSLDSQIQATRALGWTQLEFRRLEGKQLQDFPLDAVERIRETLAEAGISISGVGSKIADWSRSVDDPPDADFEDIARLIPRMRVLGAKRVRIMSYQPRRDWFEPEQKVGERVERLKRIVAAFLEAEIQPLHENCNNYGGMGWEKTLELVEKVPGLKLAFDTANPANTPLLDGNSWERRQSPWEFYRNVKAHIDVVHVKDAVWLGPPANHPFICRYRHVFPGEGEGEVKKILADLVETDFPGPIIIEPHMVRLKTTPEGFASIDDAMRQAYVEYGRKTEALLGIDAESSSPA